MRTIEWRPDTCECVLQLQWDGTNYTPLEEVVDSFNTIYKRKRCDRHSHLIDLHDHHNAVKQENNKKNSIYNDILKINSSPGMVEFLIDNLGNFTFYLPNVFTELEVDYLEELYPDVIFII